MAMEARKRAICNALSIWINQRPGLDPRNYISGWNDSAGRSAYRSESRRITRQGHDARGLLRVVELYDSIGAEDILAACRAFSGRLTIKVETRDDGHVYAGVDYCTGQYWPTEYRAAAAAVLAQCLWDWKRDHCMPKSELVHNSETGETFERYNGMRAGDYIRKTFRREFGATMQKRYFD